LSHGARRHFLALAFLHSLVSRCVMQIVVPALIVFIRGNAYTAIAAAIEEAMTDYWSLITARCSPSRFSSSYCTKGQ
jgi:hypothetical protein